MLLSASVSKDMRTWDISRCLSTRVDVRDSGGHVDVTLMLWARTLATTVYLATKQVALVGALVSRLLRLLGSVRTKSPSGGLHAAEDAGGC